MSFCCLYAFHILLFYMRFLNVRNKHSWTFFAMYFTESSTFCKKCLHLKMCFLTMQIILLLCNTKKKLKKQVFRLLEQQEERQKPGPNVFLQLWNWHSSLKHLKRAATIITAADEIVRKHPRLFVLRSADLHEHLCIVLFSVAEESL